MFEPDIADPLLGVASALFGGVASALFGAGVASAVFGAD